MDKGKKERNTSRPTAMKNKGGGRNEFFIRNHKTRLIGFSPGENWKRRIPKGKEEKKEETDNFRGLLIIQKEGDRRRKRKTITPQFGRKLHSSIGIG